MNTKSSWILLALVVLAAFLAPIVPNDKEFNCKQVSDGVGGTVEECVDASPYISMYTKFFK